jgi:nucleotide-binding universal stress UspA family protein
MSTDTEQVLQNSGDEIRTMLVAVDASTGAGRVISTAARLSRTSSEPTLHVAHVFRASRLDRARAGAPPVDTDAIEDAKAHLQALVRSARAQTRAEVMGHFLVGDPTAEVLRLCEQLHPELLVVGTHDHVGLERLILGSIAETLVRKAGCSVLVVRPRRGL